MADQRMPRAGEIWAFQHAPIHEACAPIDRRYSALKILGESAEFGGLRICYVVLDGVFPHFPATEEVRALLPLRRTRFSCKGDAAMCSVPKEWSVDLRDFRFVGEVPLTEADEALLRECRSISTWTCANSDAEGEWRWHNDRAAYEADVAEGSRLRDARLNEERERRKQSLKRVGLETILADGCLVSWDERTFLPAEFVDEVRDYIQVAVEQLGRHGRKPAKRQVSAIVKGCFDQINAADVAAGYLLETEEREELAMLLGDIASVAGHEALRDEIGRWVFLS